MIWDLLRRALPFIMLWMAICVFLLLFTSLAYSHKAKTGWEYDAYCCSDKDCTHVDKMEFKPNGDTIAYTGMFSPITIKQSDWKRLLGEGRLKPSQDQAFHICAYEYASTDREGNVTAGHWVRCLYSPGGF